MYAKRRMKYRGANIGRIVADLVATLADDERIEILREPHDNSPDTVQIVIWSRDMPHGTTNAILDVYETTVPRLTF